MRIDPNEITDELRKVGWAVDDIYDLVNSKKSYPEAVPILIELLRRGISDERMKEGVIRALTVKEAKGKAGEALLDEFFRTADSDFVIQWTIGNAMSVVVTDADLDKVLKIIVNPRYGQSREMFVIAAGKIKSAKSEEALLKLIKRKDLPGHVIKALGTLRSKKSIPYLLPFLDDKNAWIRREAKAAIEKIHKSEAGVHKGGSKTRRSGKLT